jgi:hypothetical protein
LFIFVCFNKLTYCSVNLCSFLSKAKTEPRLYTVVLTLFYFINICLPSKYVKEPDIHLIVLSQQGSEGLTFDQWPPTDGSETLISDQWGQDT